MNTPSLIVLLPLLLGAAFGQVLPDLETKPVRFTVLDPAGSPVEDALVEASEAGRGVLTGRTDARGQLALRLPAEASLSVYVSKNGYYDTGGELFRGGLHKGHDGRLVARRLPDSFTIELKDVRELVPMKHLRFRGNAPLAGQPVGFDFIAGDWVAPFGKGSLADLSFHFHDIQVEGETFTGTMTITFPNPDDGIQPFTAARPFSRSFGSNLAPPHKAPLEGYQPVLTYTKSFRPEEGFEGYEQKDRNYLLRTRTRRDADGRILQACYGWILGEIEFDPRDPKGPQLVFAYYLNPDPSPDARSLEYDLYAPRPRD